MARYLLLSRLPVLFECQPVRGEVLSMRVAMIGLVRIRSPPHAARVTSLNISPRFARLVRISSIGSACRSAQGTSTKRLPPRLLRNCIVRPIPPANKVGCSAPGSASFVSSLLRTEPGAFAGSR